ncbi:hypothetical protein HWV03_17845 [Moritella sp. 36]|uniref:hypothetical protein n=1 Tax=Moritella sp. 36 TaxID=2746233 RepID=UPI001BACB1A8|nr:hypothetical protein [Moritella sp. 36]QUM90525.1 hypothetical protein HWV03_17845 [Moritella sp. 36]
MYRVVIIFFVSILSGCKLLPPNFINQDNSVVVNNPDVSVEIDENYSYLGEFEFSDYLQYSNSLGGTTHNGDGLVFYNPKDKSFVTLKKKTCNRCVFDREAIPNVIKIDRNVFNKYKGRFRLSTDTESETKLLALMQSTDDSITTETIFNYKEYSYASGKEYFQLRVIYNGGKPSVEVDNIVRIVAI